MKSKMAACHGSGYNSPPPIGRTVDRVFEDAQFTGEIYLNGRKLRDYPKIYSKYDMSDTVLVDISRNKLTEVPHEVCEYLYVERINCYHNVIRSIPDTIQQLQILTHLNLSRNQLTVFPPALCMLSSLEVLWASNNKLVSLPEELSQLKNLMDLDVSCNEISHLPVQIGDLSSLRCLNLRRNLLVELPLEICRLQLYRLDISSNRIEKIPTVFRKMETLQQFILDHNPLSSPPAYICIKGKQHIMKFLQIEAVKEDRKRGVLMGSDSDMKRFIRKSLPPNQPSDDFKNLLGAPESKWKRHTVLSNDSGYSTADGSERNGWQSGEIYPLGEEDKHPQFDILKRHKEDQTHYQTYQSHDDHPTNHQHYIQHQTTAVSSITSSINVIQPRGGPGMYQQPLTQKQLYSEPGIPGRKFATHTSASYSHYQHQPHDPPHLQHASTTSSQSPASFNHSLLYSAPNYRTTIPSPAFSSRSFDNQTSAHNNSFDGSEISMGLSRQRSTTSLSDYQSKHYSSSLSRYTTQRPHSPSSLARYRSDSPSPRYRTVRHATDSMSPRNGTDNHIADSLSPQFGTARHTTDSPSPRNGTAKHATDYSGNSLTPFLPNNSSIYARHRDHLSNDRDMCHPPSNRLDLVGRESPPVTPPTPPIIMSGDLEDEFTRELKRQKAEYERKKKQAEMIRVQQEEEEEREKEERRRAVLKVQGEQKMLMERQEEQRRHEEMQQQEMLRRQEEMNLLEARRRKEEEDSHRREEEIQKLQNNVRVQDGDQLRQKEETDKLAEFRLTDKNNLNNKNALSSQSFKERRKLGNSMQYRRAASDTIKKLGPTSSPDQVDNLNSFNRNGVTENSQQSSTSTTPSVSPSPSPRNSVSHLAKPNSPSGSSSHLAKPISPSGSTSHVVKPTATKSSVPRASNGQVATAQSQAVRKTKMAGDRSNTSSPVTARSTRITGAGNLRGQGPTLNHPAPSNLRRSSNSSTTDDDPRSKKGPLIAPTEASRLKSQLDEQNKKGITHGSAGKVQKVGIPDSVDTNKRINTRPPTNIYGLGRGRPGGPKTLEDSSSNLTTRRKEEKEEAEQMDRLRQMVESRLRVTLPDNLAEALRDGVVLCHLANQIRPRSVGSIHVPSPAVPKLTLAKCRRNVDNFLDACRKIGVDQEQLCGPQDIFDEKGMSRVAITVAALVAIGTNPRQSAV